MKTPTTAVLAVAGCSFDIEFPSASVAQDLADSIKATMDATSSRRSGPPWIGEHERLVRSCIYLGGAYLPLQSGVAVDLIFREGALEIFNHPATFRSAPLYEIAYGPEFAIETSGPGKVTKGGGFIGGGFGLVGAVEGMAIAGLLNAITTRTSIVTVLTVADNKHEAFFVTSAMVPEDLRRGLSPVFVRLRQYRQPELSPAVTAMPTADDLVSKLERLGALRASAVLTDDEFVAAKAALLAGHVPGGAELSG